MLERTAKAAAEAGLENVEVLEAEMEAIPLPDASVDHVISNGVVNLAPRKRPRPRRVRARARARRQAVAVRPDRQRRGASDRDPQPPATWAG